MVKVTDAIRYMDEYEDRWRTLIGHVGHEAKE